MRRSHGLVGLLFLLAATSARAQEVRYSAVTPGGVVATGNTLGLSKQPGENGPGPSGSIGTFLTLLGGQDDVPANVGNPWPAGTTNEWASNGSSAVLDLPGGATVLYAELVWGGSYAYGAEDVTALLDEPVTLASGDSSVNVEPDPDTAVTIAIITTFAVRYYMRSADVTAFVRDIGAGTYSASGVPATQTTAINTTNAAGWTLVVAYRDETVPLRKLAILVGGEWVDETAAFDYAVGEFCAPAAGAFGGAVVVSAIEGDADGNGDQLLLAPTVDDTFTALDGSNNPADNFFCSQLNDASGNVDTRGSFGLANHIPGNNCAGCRQGWDVTTIPLASGVDGLLVPGQESIALRAASLGDSYLPTLAAFALDVNAPGVNGTGTALTADPDTVTAGDTVTLTATIENTTDVDAQSLRFALQLDPALSLVAVFSDGDPGDIEGVPVDQAALAAGIDEGSLGAGETRTVSLTLEVTATPELDMIALEGTWSYDYQQCDGDPLLSETVSRRATVNVEEATGQADAGASAQDAGSGSDDAGSGGSDDAGSGGSADDDGGGGCGCGAAHDRDGAEFVWFVLAALLFVRRARRA